jgi:hypothetical protein
LSQLHFGSFNEHRNGLTDVVANVGGHWSLSEGGRSGWQPLNSQMSDSLDSVLIADLDGKGIDDILRFNRGRWEVSVAGRTPWQTLANMSTFETAGGAFVGHFDGGRSAQLLVISMPEPLSSIAGVDPRRSRIFRRAIGTFVGYSSSAY